MKLCKTNNAKMSKCLSISSPKQFIVLVGIIAASLAAPLDDSKNAQITKYESDNIGIGGYSFA